MNWYFFKFAYRGDDGKRHTMQSKNLLTLYHKVLDTGNDFIVSDIKKARTFLNKYCDDDSDYKILFAKITSGKNEGILINE